MVAVRTPAPEDLARIAEAVRQAETTTSGEIFVVIARAAEEHRLVGIFWAAIASLLIGAVLHLATPLSSGLAILVEAIAFVSLAIALSQDAIRYRLIPPGVADSAVEAAAKAQFLAHGIHLTEARTGVLIYVALAEHRVEVVADRAINERVEQPVWDEIADDVVTAARAGRVVDGLVAAIDHARVPLAAHFPPGNKNANELPDHVVVM
jgi:putative membrane protein